MIFTATRSDAVDVSVFVGIEVWFSLPSSNSNTKNHQFKPSASCQVSIYCFPTKMQVGNEYSEMEAAFSEFLQHIDY